MKKIPNPDRRNNVYKSGTRLCHSNRKEQTRNIALLFPFHHCGFQLRTTKSIMTRILSFFGSLLGLTAGQNIYPPPAVMGDESIMNKKEHGTSHVPVMKNLRWGCDWDTADRICNFNRHYAERAGYWVTTRFLQQETPTNEEKVIDFYDSNTGKVLFSAPQGRSFQEFVEESQKHGWPSFRDNEVNWDYVRVLPNGETVSVDGTHLGHNLPDQKGSRYCINLVSVAGNPNES